MKNLPIDLLIMIFLFLAQSDKLECMTVCRQWHDIIHYYCLFRVICIYHKNQLSQLIKKVRDDPILGKKVERLTIEPSFYGNLELKNLSTLFPNLLHFDLLSSIVSGMLPENQVQLDQSHSWCEFIETIEAAYYDFKTIKFFLSGVCNNLTQIAVRGPRNAHFNFERLINAPALEILQLTSYALSFHDLELLHETSLQLHTLSLQKVTFNNATLPLNIKPATSIKKLLFLKRSLNFNNKHFLYIGQKYTQVENLKIDLENFDFGAVDAISEEQQRDVVASYFTKLGPRLKTFSLSMNLTNIKSVSSIFDLNVFNQCGAQIKTLDLDVEFNAILFFQIDKFIIANDIQSLSVYYAFQNTICFRWLLEFTVLKELTLGHSRRLINWFTKFLNVRDLIANLGNTRLETLRLYDSNLLLKNSNEPMLYPWLKDITLSNTTFPEGIDAFMSGSFPNLKRLKLESCLKSRNSFKLPSIDLCYLKVREKKGSNCFPIMLTTLEDNQSRLYRSGRKGYCVRSDKVIERDGRYSLPSTSSVPRNATKKRPKLTIVCKSVKYVIMENIEDKIERKNELF